MHRFETPAFWIGATWLAWLISWIAAAFWSERATVRARGQWRYRLITLFGLVVLLRPFSRRDGLAWGSPPFLGSIGFALLLIGIGFAWWARLHLGRLWSGNVTRKADHRVIDSGPYALVRHPIYTGLLLGLIGTAIARGHLSDYLGVAIIIFGTYLKARLEESFLREQLGAAAYNAYATRVPMLVPFSR